MKISFRFRCSAFGVAYYDCFTPEGTFEVQHTGKSVESCPPISAHYSTRPITPEIQSAWESFCAQKLADFRAWIAKHPEMVEFADKELLPGGAK